MEIKSCLDIGAVDVALSLMTPTIAKTGLVCGYDILSLFCAVCTTDEEAFRVANVLVQMGYTYSPGCSSAYSSIAAEQRWKLFHHLLELSGAYYDTHRLMCVIDLLDRRQLEPWFDRGIVVHTYAKYEKWRLAREKARSASIALIGAGKKMCKIDVFRIISRVAWSLRDQAEWITE